MDNRLWSWSLAPKSAASNGMLNHRAVACSLLGSTHRDVACGVGLLRTTDRHGVTGGTLLKTMIRAAVALLATTVMTSAVDAAMNVADAMLAAAVIALAPAEPRPIPQPITTSVTRRVGLSGTGRTGRLVDRRT